MSIGLRTGLIAFAAIPLILVATNVQVWGQNAVVHPETMVEETMVEGPDSWPRPGCPPRCNGQSTDRRAQSPAVSADSDHRQLHHVPPDLGAPDARVSGGAR